MPHDPPKWYDEKADNPPWIKALAEVRRGATLEGYCYHHVQAIIVAIDQSAEAALGNREYFLNKPHRIRGFGIAPPIVTESDCALHPEGCRSARSRPRRSRAEHSLHAWVILRR
jgi:hypothetical protein